MLQEHERFTDSCKRVRIACIEAARNRPEEFQKRLNSFMEKIRRNKRIMGYGGIDRYDGRGNCL